MDYGALFIPIITLITSQITILDLAQFRYPPKKLIVILGTELVIQVAINAPLLIFAGMEQYARYYSVSMVLPAILTFWYLSKRRDFRDLFTALLTIFISFSISVPAMWLTKFFNIGYLWYNLFRILFFAALFLFIHIVMRKHYMQAQNEIVKGWGIFSILPFIGSTMLYYQYWKFSMDGSFLDMLMNCFITILIMATVFVVFFYVFAQLHEKYIVQEQKRILAIQNKAQRTQFEHQKEDAEKTNRRWHDMRHHLQEMIELLEEGNTEAALIYLKEQRGADKIQKVEYCLHPAVNSILCLWAEKSRKAGIELEIKTDVPEKLGIEEMELSALFANAFENAYEGCMRLANDTHRFIKVEAHHNGRRLAIGLTNTCKNDIRFDEGRPVSSKNGGGVGTRSIGYTVKRFHGTEYYEAKNGIFNARFILNV